MTIDYRALANPFITQLTPYQPGYTIEQLQRELGITAIIKLASNENPLGPSPYAIKAAQQALLQSHYYPDGGCYEIKKALAEFYQITIEQITLGNGSENILELLIKSYLSYEHNAIVSQFAFLTIQILIQSYGNMKMIQAKQFAHDIHAMINAIDDKTKLLFLVNPNNPTGTYINQHDFIFLLNHVPKQVIIVVDEAYVEYVTKTDYPNTLSFLAHYPNLVIIRTFSKVYGLAALRLGYAISSPEIADILNRARLPFNVNTIAATAAHAALLDQQHVTQSVQMNEQGKQFLENKLAQLNLEFISSTGNFISIHVGDGQFQYQCLLNQGIIVRPLHAYHMPEYIRVTIGTQEQNQYFIQTLTRTLNNKASMR